MLYTSEMAMQPALAVIVPPDKIHAFQWYKPQQQHQSDEKEGFTMWLRGEFAAANAMIDALCHHLRAVGGPGEYDDVVGCIQQRRCNWNPVLHMQQYFSIAEVVHALQHVGWRRRQENQQQKGIGKRGGVKIGGQKGHFGTEANGVANGGYGVRESFKEKDENKEFNEKPEVHSSPTTCENTQADVVQAEIAVQEKVTPKTFVAPEIFDGKSVNSVEGMKLYEGLFGNSEILKLITLVSDLRAAGRKGQLQGQTYVASKRPMRGHGREIIQLSVPIEDVPSEDKSVSGLKDKKTEPMPTLLQNIVEVLLTEQVLSIKPDTCFIDIFNEGDHSQPHMWPQSYERPVCMLFLTDCDMTFGKVISADHRGDYRGALELSLIPGSVLVMQGNSADFSQHAIPSLKKRRIRVTLLKSQPEKKRTNSIDPPPLLSSTSQPPPSHWAPQHPIRPINHDHVQHFTTPIPQIPQPNVIQPIFFATAGITYPSRAGWPSHPPLTRLAVPGTGVFIPSQGSGNPSNQTQNIDSDASTGDDSFLGKPNGTTVHGSPEHEVCGGSLDRTSENTEILTKGTRL